MRNLLSWKISVKAEVLLILQLLGKSRGSFLLNGRLEDFIGLEDRHLDYRQREQNRNQQGVVTQGKTEDLWT